MSIDPSARDVVRQRVVEGLRHRRARVAARQMARVAPWVAGVVLAVALAARLLAWPAMVTWTTFALAAVGLAGWFLWVRRISAPTDGIASSLDADAGLRGELRSAFWFSDQREPGPWAIFHLEHAARRLAVLQWSDFYPPVRAARTWAITAALAIASLGLTVRMPARHAVAPSKSTAAVESDQLPLEALLPPDVRRRLEDLLSQIEKSKIAAADAKAKLDNLNELLSKIDPSLEPALAELAKRSAEAAVAAEKNNGDKSLAKRAEAAAKSDLPEDLRQQLEDLASRLANPRVAERQGDTASSAAASDKGQLGKASPNAEAQQANAAQAAMQLSREAASDPQSGKMMLAGAGAMGGDSRSGAGGNSGGKNNQTSAALIAQALKQELIEASADTQGQNVTSEDIRRKTEQGKSTLGFTHVVAPPAVDPSRTLPPPPVPDARKALVMQYFIRR